MANATSTVEVADLAIQLTAYSVDRGQTRYKFLGMSAPVRPAFKVLEIRELDCCTPAVLKREVRA
jgi:hypothetical protein